MLIHRRAAHGMQGRGDHRNKGGLNNHDADGWQKKSAIEDSSASSGAQLETSNVLVGDHCIPVNQVRHDGEAVQTKSDPADSYAQVMHTPLHHFYSYDLLTFVHLKLTQYTLELISVPK